MYEHRARHQHTNFRALRHVCSVHIRTSGAQHNQPEAQNMAMACTHQLEVHLLAQKAPDPRRQRRRLQEPHQALHAAAAPRAALPQMFGQCAALCAWCGHARMH